MPRFAGPFESLTPAQKLELEAHMDALRAEDELREGVPDDRVYDAVLRATGSEDRASAALTARISAKLRRGQTPEV